MLTPSQTDEWDAERRFNVVTPLGSLYDVKSWGQIGHTYNVRLLDGNPLSPRAYQRARPGCYMCAYALPHAWGVPDWLPMCDHLVAQKLLLEAPGGEMMFLRVANIQPSLHDHYRRAMPGEN